MSIEEIAQTMDCSEGTVKIVDDNNIDFFNGSDIVELTKVS